MIIHKIQCKPVCKPAMTSLDDQLKPASFFQQRMCKISNSLATIGKYLQTTMFMLTIIIDYDNK